ncbi:MAG: hypothetical protein GYA41_09245 [Bacteroidales bacterium]|nr:hypothetical protein [Bacteroidales bacterium]
METKYEWKTSLFASDFELFKNGIRSGFLNKGNFRRKVTGELNMKNVLFTTKGFFGNETGITDPKTGVVYGRIVYSVWKSRASVEYQGKLYNWQFDNFFRTRWSIENENGILIRYKSVALKGFVYSYTGDEVLILTGFFIRNFFRQRSAGIANAL